MPNIPNNIPEGIVETAANVLGGGLEDAVSTSDANNDDNSFATDSPNNTDNNSKTDDNNAGNGADQGTIIKISEKVSGSAENADDDKNTREYESKKTALISLFAQLFSFSRDHDSLDNPITATSTNPNPNTNPSNPNTHPSNPNTHPTNPTNPNTNTSKGVDHRFPRDEYLRQHYVAATRTIPMSAIFQVTLIFYI